MHKLSAEKRNILQHCNTPCNTHRNKHNTTRRSNRNNSTKSKKNSTPKDAEWRQRLAKQNELSKTRNGKKNKRIPLQQTVA